MKKITFALFTAILVLGIMMNASQTDSQSESSINDTIQSDVAAILEKHMREYNAEEGQVIVVESATGKIRARVGLVERSGQYVANPEAFEHGHKSHLHQALSLLGILETGKLSLDSIIDTGNGIYVLEGTSDTIFDHNWHSGGYGKLSLRDVFAKESLAGMEQARVRSNSDKWDNSYEQEWKIIKHGDEYKEGYLSSYGVDFSLYEMDFYNAIAISGKMIRITDKEGTIEVINPQIAKAENIDSLKSAMRYFVTNGLGMKANSDKVSIAGECATIQYDGDDRIFGDFIGYFPTESPQYTVYVSLMKRSYPLSAGGMCGPILKEIAVQ